jgi:hypothetical protein
MSKTSNPTVATMGIDIGKNSFHIVGLGQRGAIMLRQRPDRSAARKQWQTPEALPRFMRSY